MLLVVPPRTPFFLSKADTPDLALTSLLFLLHSSTVMFSTSLCVSNLPSIANGGVYGVFTGFTTCDTILFCQQTVFADQKVLAHEFISLTLSFPLYLIESSLHQCLIWVFFHLQFSGKAEQPNNFNLESDCIFIFGFSILSTTI